MNSAKKVDGGVEKHIYNSINATYTGGVGIDKTGFTNPDNEIPAGTLIGKPDATTGLSKVVTITGTGESATFDIEPLGLSYKSVPLDDLPFVGVVTDANVKVFCLPAKEQAAFDAIHDKIPTLKPTI